MAPPPALAEQLSASIASADADVRSARRGLTRFEEQYAQWAGEYARRAQELRAFEEGASARKPSADVIHRREFLRHEVGVAAQALERGVLTLQGAQRELEGARAFFLRLVDLAGRGGRAVDGDGSEAQPQQQQPAPARPARARAPESPVVEIEDDEQEEQRSYELPQDDALQDEEPQEESAEAPGIAAASFGERSDPHVG